VPRRLRAALVLALAAGLTACGIPADPEGTLSRIDAGTVRVGASPHGELVVVDGRDVSGPLADLVEGFAASRGAQVEWTVDSEEALVDDLEGGRLDLAIGGMTDQTPWVERASATRGYTGIPGAGEASVVILLPLGENATQAALESYLDRELPR